MYILQLLTHNVGPLYHNSSQQDSRRNSSKYYSSKMTHINPQRNTLKIQHNTGRSVTGALSCDMHPRRQRSNQSTDSTSITPDWTRLPSTLRLPRFAGPASALDAGGGGGGGGAEDAALLVGPPAFPDAALVTF